MSFELSLQIKILALVGLLLAVAGAGTLVLAHRHSTAQPVVPVVTHVAATQTTTRTTTTTHPVVPTTPAAKPVAAPIVLDPSLPTPLQHALRQSKVVVAVVYAPGDAADAQVLAEARQGAASTHAGFVTLNVLNDTVAGMTAAWMNHVVEPAVVVVTRPGTIAAELDGYADSTMVAQAVVDSR